MGKYVTYVLVFCIAVVVVLSDTVATGIRPSHMVDDVSIEYNKDVAEELAEKEEPVAEIAEREDAEELSNSSEECEPEAHQDLEQELEIEAEEPAEAEEYASGSSSSGSGTASGRETASGNGAGNQTTYTFEEDETTETVTTNDNQGASGSDMVWVEPVYEQVWVVDREAQTVELPIYETRERTVCNGCGADISGFASEHIGNRENVNCYGCRTEAYEVIVGYQTIEEPEEGHWEQVLVSEGYWIEASEYER